MPNNISKENIWLVGAGQMAVDYANILLDLKKEFLVVGRSEKSATSFKEKVSVDVFTGGIKKAKDFFIIPPQYAIVAVNVENLKEACFELLNFGVKNILLEKPGGLNKDEINDICELANKSKAKVFIAYNRRFLSSVIKAKEIIFDDGGVTSCNFEFTEWSHVIEKLDKPKEILEEWFLANSTHVVDLAFHLAGEPKQMSAYVSGTTDWYKKASVFAGAGVTKTGALLSYQANWKGPGRWALEIITKKHRLIFRPLEKLQIQNIGSVAIEFLEIDDTIDIKFKPGLYLQTKAFLTDNFYELVSIDEQLKTIEFYEKMQIGGVICEL